MLAGNAVTINGDGKYIRDYVYGPDVARANVAALTTSLTRTFTSINIGTGLGVDVNELASLISARTQSHLRQTGNSLKIPEARHAEPHAGDLRSNLVSPELAGRLLDWKPGLPLKQGIEQTVAWFAD